MSSVFLSLSTKHAEHHHVPIDCTERVSVGSSGPAGCAVGALCVTWALCSQGGGGVISGSKWVKPSTGKALPHQTKDVPRLVGQKMGAWGPQHPREACMEPLGHPMLTGGCGVIYGSNWVKPRTTRALPHQKIDVHGLVGTEVGAWGPEQAREVSSGPSGVLSPPAWETRHRPSPPF